eukprot:SAG22_NODE_6122_length_895_cov_4.087940_2_plen_60_part_00
MTTYLDMLPDELYIKIYEQVNRQTLVDAASSSGCPTERVPTEKEAIAFCHVLSLVHGSV